MHPSEISDVTEQVRKDQDGSAKARVLVPKGTPFNFTYPIPEGRAPEPAKLLEALVDYHRTTGAPGSASVADRSHLPHRAHDDDGGQRCDGATPVHSREPHLGR